MPFGFRGSRFTIRRLASTLVAALAVGLGACDKGADLTDPPDLPNNPPLNPQVRGTAFIFDVNMQKREVKVTAPSASLQSLARGRAGDEAPSFSMMGPNFSILGGDVIELVTGSFDVTSGGGFASGSIPVGPCPGGAPAAVPGKLCVEFDVQVINELLGIQLVGPQVFPTPPPGTTGPLMFAYDIVLTPNTPGTTVGGPQGNDVIVELPNTGEVSISEEWAGAPFNFFNDASCAGAGSGTGQNGSDCFRYEEITPTPLTGGASSDAKRVGFYIDPTVGNFRVRVLVAADLQNQSGSASGTIAGSVSSPQLGDLNGVQINVTGGFTGTTSGTGDYSITSVGLGSRTVSIVGGLPAGCTTPASQTTTVTNGGTSTVDFVVTCPVAVGTINGTITSSLGGGIAGASVVITPAGGSALSAASTNASGQYNKSGVPLGTPSGTGAITLSGLPAGCTAPAPTAYSGLTNGGTIAVNITVTCAPPPSVYYLNGAWSGTGGAGSNRTYTMTFDLTQRDDPAIPGADDLSTISGTTTFNNTLLTFASSSNVAGSALTNQGAGLVSANAVAWLNFNSSATAATGSSVGVINLVFTVNGTTAGTVTPVTTFGATDDVLSGNFTDLKPNTVVQDTPLTLP